MHWREDHSTCDGGGAVISVVHQDCVIENGGVFWGRGNASGMKVGSL